MRRGPQPIVLPPRKAQETKLPETLGQQYYIIGLTKYIRGTSKATVIARTLHISIGFLFQLLKYISHVKEKILWKHVQNMLLADPIVNLSFMTGALDHFLLKKANNFKCHWQFLLCFGASMRDHLSKKASVEGPNSRYYFIKTLFNHHLTF